MINFKVRGFGLIEVLIALALVMVGVVGLVKIQAYLGQKNEYAYGAMIALQQAENKFEFFKSHNPSVGSYFTYDDIVTGSEVSTVNDIDYHMSWVVTDSIPELGALTPTFSLKEILLTVTWQDQYNIEQSLQLQTAISRYSKY
ncbi:hypothetical protein VST7929_00569 [Vibrio stylophorae]|uniref:Type IV pilin n=1 Tax=Vibrio stylophorae TaxID=659351 RepID=A0ABM8ZRK3_9VIBR|nr:prepilin-type N-terminal cleavage/methylation domain-containing protein [Vibrio stylophorae]CAH0532724.1 hypothetical protein VST7929_00569 [Vibrio stylophorae]